MPFGRKSPLEALALPGVMLAYKYSQFRQRRREAASRRVTERELSALHHKIDKLLSKLEESEPDPPTSQEDECVICINARATMQTSPCGHRVVCRRCFVKTIQSAVAQRLLPLRCVICRARVNRLTSSSGTWRIQESASSYSMGSKSWASAAGGVPASASSYSMNDAHSGLGVSVGPFHGPASAGARFAPRSPHNPRPSTVAQSASLYSMSSGSSTLSSASNATNYSKTSSSVSSGLYTPSPSPSLSQSASASVSLSSPISPSAMSASSLASLRQQHQQQQHHLAPPAVGLGLGHGHGHSSHSHSSSSSSSSSTSPGSGSGSGSLSPRDLHPHPHHHPHHAGCPSGCSGAVPRKPLQSLVQGGGAPSSGIAVFAPSTHTYPGRRHTKGRLVDLQNRLPPIKEFRSPAKVPHPSPVHISNPRFRYSSYTKSAPSAHEMVPLLREPPSPPRRPMNIHVTSSLTTLGPPPLKGPGLSAKISPLTTKNSLPKSAYAVPKDKKGNHNNNSSQCNGKLNNHNNNSSSHTNNNNAATKGSNNSNGLKKILLQDFNSNAPSGGGGGGGGSGATTTMNSKSAHHRPSSSSRSFPLFSSSNNHKEKADNKKNESMERKKKEEKLKLKAEKEARKEEKRLAKEEERMAKLLAKEEKKKGKKEAKEAKELLLANDGNSKK